MDFSHTLRSNATYLNRIRHSSEFGQFMSEMKTLNEKYEQDFGEDK